MDESYVRCASLVAQEDNLMAINSFLVYVKMFKYLNNIPKLARETNQRPKPRQRQRRNCRPPSDLPPLHCLRQRTKVPHASCCCAFDTADGGFAYRVGRTRRSCSTRWRTRRSTSCSSCTHAPPVQSARAGVCCVLPVVCDPTPTPSPCRSFPHMHTRCSVGTLADIGIDRG